MAELKTIFGSFCSEADLKQIMSEVDSNGDGEISFEEFKNMMCEFKTTNYQLHTQWSF